MEGMPFYKGRNSRTTLRIVILWEQAELTLQGFPWARSSMASSVLWPCEHCVRFISAQQKSPDSDDKTTSRARQGPMMRSSGRNVAQNLKVAALWGFISPDLSIPDRGLRSRRAGRHARKHVCMQV